MLLGSAVSVPSPPALSARELVDDLLQRRQLLAVDEVELEREEDEVLRRGGEGVGGRQDEGRGEKRGSGRSQDEGSDTLSHRGSPIN